MARFDIKSVLLGIGIGIIITSTAGMIYNSTEMNSNSAKSSVESSTGRSTGIFTDTDASTGEGFATK